MNAFLKWFQAVWYAYLNKTMASQDNSELSVPIITTSDMTPQASPEPQNAPVAPVIVKINIETFCGHIRDYEGKPGALNYQLNNPGDCRPSPVGYLAKYQPVVIIDTDTNPAYPYDKGKFAKFPTYELGWEYLCALVQGIAVAHPNETLLTFFSNYAPSSDKNDPSTYAAWMAAQCNVGITTTLQELLG